MSDQMEDILKVFIDDESYNNGHGHAYDTLGIDPLAGAVIVVRPDQYVSFVTDMEDFDGLGNFFEGALKKNVTDTAKHTKL